MQNPFSTYHPAVAFAYLACAIALSMAAMHPALAVISLLGSLACSLVVRGLRRTVHACALAAAAVAIVAAANGVFVAAGSTELLRVGSRVLYGESFVYGLTAGMMLASVLLWFASYAACMDSDASMSLFGGLAPTVSLMVSQVLRLVPQFVSRGRNAVAVQDAMTSASARSKGDEARDRMRVVSVLMGWGMEDGLVRGDAMRARGYGCGARRTTYRRHRVRRSDVAALVVIIGLFVLSALCVWLIVSRFSFYPALGGFSPWWLHIPYVLLVAVAPVLALREWWQWR